MQGDGDAERAALPRLVEDELAIQARRRRRAARSATAGSAGSLRRGAPRRGRSRSCCRASRARRARPPLEAVRSLGALRDVPERTSLVESQTRIGLGGKLDTELAEHRRGSRDRPRAVGRALVPARRQAEHPATGSTSRACRRRRCGRRVCSRRRPSSHPRSRRIRAPRSRPRRPHAAASGSRGRPTPERRRARRSAARGPLVVLHDRVYLIRGQEPLLDEHGLERSGAQSESSSSWSSVPNHHACSR